MLGELLSIGAAVVTMIGVVVFVVLLLPLGFRLVNELACRTVGKALVICPHCGAPGVVDSRHPQVFR